jgi:hypothetical protein
MIKRIAHLGKFIDDCSLPGERRADQVAPAHGNGIQLSRDRFLVLNSTLRFRGCDDNASIVWQLRRDSYGGAVIKEGLFAQAIDDWYPLGDQYRCVRQHGHPVAFGVPKDAVIGGRPAAHANVFAVKWRRVARVFVPDGGYIMWQNEPPEVRERTQSVEWCQFRLNDAEDDIEIIQPAQRLRQVGYTDGKVICDHGLSVMNQSYVQPVPFSDDATEWVDVNHFNQRAEASRDGTQPRQGVPRVAPLRYRFNTTTGLYEWVETGPLWGSPETPLFEANISPHNGDWVLAARLINRDPGTAWMRVNDPFAESADPVIPAQPQNVACPLSVYRCPDGATRLLAGDATLSAYESNRNPLFMWDIDVDDGFRAGTPREIFDTYKAGVPIEEDHGPLIDMAKLLPHAGGTTQTLIHRVRTCAMAVTEADYPSRIRPLTDGDFTGTAIYHATVEYEESCPGVWEFPG